MKEVSVQKITPCLWFDNDAEKAMKFYGSIFKDLKVLEVTRWGKDQPGPKGKILTVKFRLAGQEFVGLNGGPQFKFTEAVSFMVDCKTQQEIDRLWKKLSAGGEESQCGWLKDKFGLSWQIVPSVLPKMIADKDPEKSGRVMNALMKMGKLDIAELKRAYNGRS
jgi:predicted 3-demethylubiquinone-9 3-methyltransferase (glyoxalase superfamily)